MVDLVVLLISFIGISIILAFVVYAVLDWIQTFIYFFIRDNSEVMGEMITGITMASAGTPGYVEVTFPLLSQDYDYTVDFGDKIIFVTAEYKGKSIFNIEDLLRELITNIPSTLGVSVLMPDESLKTPQSVSVVKSLSELEDYIQISPPIPAGAGKVAAPARMDRLAWPTTTACVSSSYRPPERPTHDGIDIAVVVGTSIYASQVGVVDRVTYSSGYGNHIRLKHETEGGLVYYTYYAHIKCGGFKVKVGQQVFQGQHIADSGGIDSCKGSSKGAHLHFEIRRESLATFDPCPFFDDWRCTSCS